MNAHALFPFPGGLRLPQWKSLSDHRPLKRVSLPETLTIPLSGYGRRPVRPLVKPGDSVSKGDPLTDPAEPGIAPVHASSSGLVAMIEQRPTPDGEPVTSVVLRTDGRDERGQSRFKPIDNLLSTSADTLLERIRACGVVGLGGAGFPTAVKLSAARRAGVRTLVINAVECEPCMTCDDRLLRERADDVVSGIRILAHLLGTEQTLVALEEDREEAFNALTRALQAVDDRTVRVVPVPPAYPAGSERQLILALTGREVPAGGLPVDMGVICQNVGTVAAVHSAVTLGEPQTQRIVTVTGPGVRHPCNLLVPIGTPLSHVIHAAGGYTDTVTCLIMGGPMMGIPLPHDDFPVTSATNCLLAVDAATHTASARAMPCIRCGDCARVCPSALLPQQLYWHAQSDDLDGLRDHHLPDCIECGACDYVCPSHLPLTRIFRESKAAIREQDRAHRKAEEARERYELRRERLERQQRDMEERRRSKKEALQRRLTQPQADDPRKAAIRAAIERAKRKKATHTDGQADER